MPTSEVNLAAKQIVGLQVLKILLVLLLCLFIQFNHQFNEPKSKQS